MKKWLMALTLALPVFLCGCGMSSTKQTILDKARNVTTKQELEQALGKPSEVSGGSAFGVEGELWKYKASDGTVEFVIVNGKVLAKKAQ